MRKSILALVFMATVPISAGYGQSIEPAAAPPMNMQCELHVYPAAKMLSHLRGWLRAGTVDGGQKGKKGYPIIPPDSLNAQRQIELLNQANLALHFDLPGSKIVMHDTALQSREFAMVADRQAKAGTPCYNEFVVAQLSHDADALAGKSLNIMGRYFGQPKLGEAGQSFMSLSRIQLTKFPATDQKDTAEAQAEIERAFKTAVEEFAAALSTSRKKSNQPKKKK